MRMSIASIPASLFHASMHTSPFCSGLFQICPFHPAFSFHPVNAFFTQETSPGVIPTQSNLTGASARYRRS